MDCTSFENLDKQNPNYQFLTKALEEGTIKLLENECVALVFPPEPLDLKFGLGMKAYLESQGYDVFIFWPPLLS